MPKTKVAVNLRIISEAKHWLRVRPIGKAPSAEVVLPRITLDIKEVNYDDKNGETIVALMDSEVAFLHGLAGRDHAAT